VADDIFSRYPELRGKPRQMAMICVLLRDRGLHEDALALGEAAIAAAAGDNAIRHEVRAALGRHVAPFHGPMLLDHERNAAYAQAITAAVRPGMLVLEIGAGSGLLAMIAARAGAQVLTCEKNPMIAAAAERIVARNGLADRIRIVRKQSDALLIPEDLPAQADLVIHEIFGSQLFGEGVSDALADARNRLLKPEAPSVPPRASLRCALVTDHDRRRHGSLRDVQGFDLSHFELLLRPVQNLTASAPDRFERRSDPLSALEMDYNRAPPFGPGSQIVQLESSGGRIDGVVQWISIAFPGLPPLENDPFVGGPQSHWAAMYHPLTQPIETVPGETIRVTLRHRGTLLTIDAARL
jgi:type II protein arginine methyltransferase